jgi:hypothetical protein
MELACGIAIPQSSNKGRIFYDVGEGGIAHFVQSSLILKNNAIRVLLQLIIFSAFNYD